MAIPVIQDCGSVLAGSTDTITWTDAAPIPTARRYDLVVNGVDAGASVPQPATSWTYTNFPTDGSIVTVELQYSDDNWVTRDSVTCSFTAAVPQSNYISCPTAPIPEGTSLSLALNGGLPAGATNETYQLLSGPGTISSTSYSYPFPVAGTHTITIRRCYDLPVSADKRTRLLASPDRTGYGGSATGGTNYVFVTNEAELRQAASVDGNYVCLDSSLAGAQIGLTAEINMGSNVTIDGSLAPGSVIYPDYANGFPSSAAGNQGRAVINMFGQDNIIVHCLVIDGRRSASFSSTDPSYNTGGINIRSTNVWIDHVEVTEFWDDAIGVRREGNFTTLSNVKIHNTDKGVLYYYPDDGARFNTIFNSELAARQRNPDNTGTNLHLYNNYIHDTAFGANITGYRGTSTFNTTQQAQTLSESNYFENTLQGTNPYAENGLVAGGSTVQTGVVYTSGSTYIAPATTTGNIQPASNAWAIPYSYTPMASTEVKSYVEANAGAIQKDATAAGTVCEDDICTFTVESVAACDCSGLPALWPTQGTCGTSQLITYTMPAGATLFNGGTNITGGTLTNVTATSAVLTVACTGSGTNLSGVVQIRYTLNGESCACNTTVTVADPIITATCNDSLVTHTAVMNADGTATVTVFNQAGNGTVLINAEPATGSPVSVIGGGSGQVVTSTTTTVVNGVESKRACYSVVCA